MQATRRFWTVTSVGLFLTIWGVIVATPLVLVGSAAVAAWLLARQYRFARTVARTEQGLAVDLSIRDRLTAEETAEITIGATLERQIPASVRVTVTPPVGAQGDPVTATLAPGEDNTVASSILEWPVAGSFTIDDITARISDDDGLFQQSIALDGVQTVQITPRTPRDLHVGAGGAQLATGFGDQETSDLGTSVEPAEVREYVPGDSIRQIDWKATARHDEPHVTEVEGRANRQTLLFFDHRASMSDGRSGTRKLDYARQLALTFVDHVRDRDEGIGYYAVGDKGVTTTVSPLLRADAWPTIRDHLLSVATTTGDARTDEPARSTVRRGAAGQLATDESAFGRTLTPFFEATESYERRFDSHPLFQAVTTAEYSSSTAVRTVIVTDDSHRSELRRAVTHARDRGAHVSVFLTPTPLFKPAEIVDLDGAYDDYVEFEEFRQKLAGIEYVNAFEVGPGDRLSAILTAGRARRTKGAV